ncbi:transglycosylase SLT domain-containing protein [Streptomyces sp. BE308]|uniref:transglycosylase SLT domain-containing protein n=1 Tax=unclassified Streptomyces TaxID=2593676 RepID=UPI002DD988D6|nr:MULTISPECIES: transglycosylase SLT domain-containing protein [unclassified Streptomyces]MEE1795617.1 transglycosylase SLT domain-containing protein [Streptomyces sp. BE308]WRZ70706.1 transglycosylase SLT domain-containing protein [Streptomyces sp. NBC_01237]
MPRLSTLRNTIRVNRSQKLTAAVLVAAGSVTALAATGESSDAQPAAAHAPIAVKAAGSTGIPGADTRLTKDAILKDAVAKDAAARKAAAAKSQAAKAAVLKAHESEQSANRSTVRKAAPAPKQYKNNLDGWIRESLDIMKSKGIPGTYEGLHRNIMRESSGNPHAVNDWDINARNGIPSKGLLQVIQPTFDTYHVSGTPKKLTDPVANITAAANYAADRYGSIDNVDSAY